jgi:hypothetical protein
MSKLPVKTFSQLNKLELLETNLETADSVIFSGVALFSFLNIYFSASKAYFETGTSFY